jgi:uncharacterized protein (TIGR03435 family)
VNRESLAFWRFGVSSLCVLAALGVTSAAQAPLEFDVASIKRHVDDAPGASFRTLPDGSVVGVNATIRSFIGSAYPSQNGQYSGLPEWATTERYDVTVKPPAGATREQIREMWKTLFTERMRLVAHSEMRDEAIYNLVVARPDRKLGPQIRPSTHDCDADAAADRQRSGPPTRQLTTEADFLDSCGYRVGGGRLVGGGLTMEQIAQQLRGSVGRIVRDQTGLKGWFAVTFAFGTPVQAATPGAAADPAEPPSVFTAVQEQLGLKLEGDRMQVQTVVVDHIERPTEN